MGIKLENLKKTCPKYTKLGKLYISVNTCNCIVNT